MMAATCEPAEARRFRWTPARKALALTAGLRVFYSVLAAALSPWLRLDARLIHSNALTDHLMSRDAHPVLYALLGVWERFDTLYYARIATHGYEGPASTVFYPLFPALIRPVGWIVRSELTASVLIGTAATFFFLWGAIRLFELDLDPAASLRAVAIWLAWPGAFTFFGGYPDSLLLALMLWSIYFARTNRWGWAGLLGLLAGGTKALGCFVALPLLWIGWRQRERRSLWAAVLTCAGTAGFQAWLWAQHFPPATEVYQKYWLTSTVAPWRTLGDVAWLASHGGDALLVLNFGTLVIIAFGALGRRVRVEYQIFAAAAICLFLTKHTTPLLQSTMRYSLLVFPAFAGLASRFRMGLAFVGLVLVSAGLNVFLLRVFLDWGLVV
jgi:hypothetical protein